MSDPVAPTASAKLPGLRGLLNAGAGDDGWGVVGKWLRERYVDNVDEARRRADAQKRDDFYEGKGDTEMARLIDVAFKDKATQELRTELIEWAKFNNLIFRIVHEQATVYSAPAARKIATNNERYQAFLEVLQLDASMREVNRKLALHEDVLVMYRVRETPRGKREPVIDVVHPGRFWAIAHPKDCTMLVGIILDQRVPKAKVTDPAFRVWTDDETFVMDGECRVMAETVEPWTMGRMPGLLATTRKPGSKQRLLAECPNADLVAAHAAVWLQHILLVKESKSANKQTYVSGDTSAATMGQSADTEREVVLPDGVTVDALDRGMDLGQFRDNAKYISDTAGANHGVPPSIMNQADATSGAALDLRRLPIRELRALDIPVMRVVELELHEVMSLVNGARVFTDMSGTVVATTPGDLETYAFSTAGFSIDYAEVQQPLTEVEKDQVFDERRRLILTDNAEEEMRRNPDLKTVDDAFTAIEARIKRQTRLLALSQDLMRMNGSASSPVGAPNAQQNGAAGVAAAQGAQPAATPIAAQPENATALAAADTNRSARAGSG